MTSTKVCLPRRTWRTSKHKQNLEWYIEVGGHSHRKLRPPRMGILSYLVDAYDRYAEEDVLIIPKCLWGTTSSTRLGAISAEEMGGKKAPER